MLEKPLRADAAIAVVGFAVKFPQKASTVDGFWDLLTSGGSARTEVPENRYNAEAFHSAGSKRGTVSKPFQFRFTTCIWKLLSNSLCE